jgi:hypothetical protein
MHDIERYLLWGAIIVLFVLFLWPRSSMYRGEPNSITRLAEFTLLTPDIQRLYNDQILRAIRAWAPTINKWWADIPGKDKEQLKGMFKQTSDQMVTNAANAKTMNGVEVLQRLMHGPPRAPQTASPPSHTTMGTPAPLPNSNTVSTYMVQPFMPMVSGFNLQNALNKVSEATKVV